VSRIVIVRRIPDNRITGFSKNIRPDIRPDPDIRYPAGYRITGAGYPANPAGYRISGPGYNKFQKKKISKIKYN
jgi:hypothetical protein